MVAPKRRQALGACGDTKFSDFQEDEIPGPDGTSISGNAQKMKDQGSRERDATSGGARDM